MNQDSWVGGLEVCTLHLSWAVSPTWNWLLSTEITGPSAGKSDKRRVRLRIIR